MRQTKTAAAASRPPTYRRVRVIRTRDDFFDSMRAPLEARGDSGRGRRPLEWYPVLDRLLAAAARGPEAYDETAAEWQWMFASGAALDRWVKEQRQASVARLAELAARGRPFTVGTDYEWDFHTAVCRLFPRRKPGPKRQG
jgi:hypothetical protein